MRASRGRRAAVLATCLALLVTGLGSAAPASPAGPAGTAGPAGPVGAGGPAVLVGAGAVQPAAAGAPAYQWPLAGVPRVTRRFDPPPQRWLPGHRGVDLAGEPGEVVRAAGAGTVSFAGPVAGTGVVSVTHADGLRTTYQPVTPTVAAGEVVAAGDRLGVLEAGHAGCTAAACLHWGLRRGEVYLDPLTLLGLGRVRLLPRAG